MVLLARHNSGELRCSATALIIEVNVMKISAKFQFLLPLWLLTRGIFLVFFCKFSLSGAMATNQIQRFGQNC